MLYGSIAAHFSLALTVLLWIGVLCAAGPVQPDEPKDQETPLNIVPAPSPKTSSRWSPWLGLNDDLLSCICQFYGPVRFNASDRQKIGKVLKVLTTLSQLFKDLEYVGPIEVDEILAYYPLLSELSHVKKRYPHEIGWMLMKWPLPKENLTLSLLISTGQIGEFTLSRLASYLPYMSDKPARLAAVSYCLNVCAEGSIYVTDASWRILLSAFQHCVVRKLKWVLRPSGDSKAFIASSLLHIAPAELDGALVDDLNEALAELRENTFEAIFQFRGEFAKHPTTHHNPASRQAVYVRNVEAFRAIPFTAEQRIILSVLNKIKFGASQDIKDMSEAERKALFGMFHDVDNLALVFHIWAREDAEEDGAWAQLANDPSNTRTLSRLAFDFEGFFQNHFDVDFADFRQYEFFYFLNQFKHYPNSSKKERFQTLLTAQVQESSKTMLALFQNHGNFKSLANFFSDQRDKVGLLALNEFVSKAISNDALFGNLDEAVKYWDIISGCQLIYGHVDGVDSLGLLEKLLGAAKVLSRLDFSLLQANHVGGMLKTLGVSWAKMDAALSSLSHNDKPKDELAAMLREFQNYSLFCYPGKLPAYHSLWFYLWKQHRKAFVANVHPKIQQHYLLEESKLPKPVR